MDFGVFIPIGNNGWIISAASPQYMPSFELNKTIVQKAESYGFEFALSVGRRSSGTTISSPSPSWPAWRRSPRRSACTRRSPR
jgi:hypothetical protein